MRCAESPAPSAHDGRDADPALVERMCAALEHRGPDARGIHADGPVGLGIQRLRVVDLEGGDQPIYNEDRSIAVVLNGEIYNFRELRRRLEAAGHRFRTDGDTEVIVHLYEEEGVDCVRSLDGMFAFALWDAPRRRLLVARDRVGKKPLFYCAARRGAELRLGAAGAAAGRGGPPRRRRAGARLLPRLRLRAGAAERLPGGSQAAARDDGWSTRADAVTLERYWQLDYARKHAGRGCHASCTRRCARRCAGRSAAALSPTCRWAPSSPAASTPRRWWPRWRRRRASRSRTFSIGFDSERFDELDARAPGRGAVRHRARGAAGAPRRDLDRAADRPPLRRALRRLLRDPQLLPGRDDPPPRHRRPQRRRRRRVLRRLHALRGQRPRRAAGAPSRRRCGASAAGFAARLPEGAEEQSPRNRARRLGGSLGLDGAARYERYVSLFDRERRAALYSDEYAGRASGLRDSPPRRSPSPGARPPATTASTSCSRSTSAPTYPATCWPRSTSRRWPTRWRRARPSSTPR